MVAEGTARDGAGEAPKAELAAAKAAPPAENPAEEREGVGGPFVIVNGDSDGSSDMGAGPDADSHSDEEDLLRSNAGPDAAAGGELGALDAALGDSSSNGHVCAAVESEEGVHEAEAEEAADFEAELRAQGTASGELGGADAPAALGIDHVGADSAAPAVNSEVGSKDDEVQKGSAADIPELLVNEAVTEEQKDEVNSAGSTVLDSEDCGKESKEQIAPQIVELGTDDSGASVVSGHHDTDTSVDSCLTAMEPLGHVDEVKQHQGAPNGEQDGADALQGNGHDHVDSTVDSLAPASEFQVLADESKGQQAGEQLEAMATEAEVSEGMLDASSVHCSTFTHKEVIEGEVVGNSNGYVEDNADASLELEHGVVEREDEATSGVVELGDIIDNDNEGNLRDSGTADVVLSDEDTEPRMKEVMKEAVPAVVGTGVIAVQGHELVKDSVELESDLLVESSSDHIVQLQVAAGDENAPVSDVNAENNVGSSTTQHVNPSGAIEEKDVKKLACPEEAYLAQNDYSSGPGADIADESDSDVLESEGKKEVEMEVVDAVPSLEATVSTFHNAPRSIDLVEADRVKHSSLDNESESFYQTEEYSSPDLSRTTVGQATSGLSMEYGTTVAKDIELSVETANASHETSTEAVADEGEPVALVEDAAVVVDDVKHCFVNRDESAVVGEVADFGADCKSHNDLSEICDTSTKTDAPSSTAEDKVSIPANELVPPVEGQPHMSDGHETGKDICFENINACAKSSPEGETKCLEELASSSEVKIVEDSNDSHVDPDKRHKDDTHVNKPKTIFMVRVPRFAGEELWARTQDAFVQVDRLTRERDAITARKKKQKAVCDEYREKLEAARQEEREARAVLSGKRNEIINVQTIIGKLKQSTSIEEIDEKIAIKEKIMQHETITLKEEKLFMVEIKELRSQRKQLCSSMGSKAEISEAFHQKDHIHEQHKALKKDSDVLFKNLKCLEEKTQNIQKAFDVEKALLNKLNNEYNAAHEIRQRAYVDWSELKSLPNKKNQHYFQYRRDRVAADLYKETPNVDGLQLFCNDQIERVLEMWNKDDDFRKMYVEANKISTVRRLGTHDGRRLGPDEDPQVIPSLRNPSSLTVSSPNVPIIASESAPEKPVPVAAPEEEDSFPVLPTPNISKQAKPQASASSSKKEITTASAPKKEDVEHSEKEKARLMKLESAKKAEELELARKKEEDRQAKAAADEEEAAAEKERIRLVQKVKAKEAEERKKKKAEKAQEKAEFKARKEAEMKEKKKAKKDRKNGEPADSASEGNSLRAIATTNIDSSTSQNARDVEVSQQTAPRRISRPAAAIQKLNRVEPMPLPLRNKGKKKMRQYIIAAVVVALSVVALILAGRYMDLPILRSLPF